MNETGRVENSMVKNYSGWLLALIPLGLAIYFASLVPRIASGNPISVSFAWAPTLGVNLSFYIDGLSLILARYQDFGTADAEIADFKAAVANNTPYVPTFTIVEDPAQNSEIESTRTTNRILVILALVALVVSGFLVIVGT